MNTARKLVHLVALVQKVKEHVVLLKHEDVKYSKNAARLR
jgi:hypothetical protein